MTERYSSAGLAGPWEGRLSSPVARAAGLWELSEEMEELPIGSSISFGGFGGGWYEARKIRIFHEKNGLLAVNTREGTKTFRIQEGTTAEYASLFMQAVGTFIRDIPLTIKRDIAAGEINPDKFNCRDFCREDYEGLPEGRDFEGSIYIGKVSIGEVLIRLKMDTGGQILARFLVLDEEALYDRTEDGSPYDNAHTVRLEHSPGMDYGTFIRKARRSFADYISSYRCSLYRMTDKILHKRGDRVYVDGEMEEASGSILVQSAATVLEDETFADSQLHCCIDTLKGSHSLVPISKIAKIGRAHV